MIHPNLPPLPTLDAQLESLRLTGDQFPQEGKELSRLELPGVWMAAGDGTEKALYDARVIPSIPLMIAPSAHVHRALGIVRPDQVTVNSAGSSINSWLNGSGLIIGFSGYGTGGRYGYETEFEGIRRVFNHCKAASISIEGVVDGATGYGVPGLSGVLATKLGYPTIGFAPLRSLRGAAPRDAFIVIGEEFGDEAPALGSAPDVLIAFGGGPNAEKEVDAAMEVGSIVMLATLKQYPESSVAYLPHRSSKARAAQDAGKLLICNSIEAVEAGIDSYSLEQLRANRETRRDYLYRALAQTE